MKNEIIKLFITDIDGVWTDGGMYYTENGDEVKKFNTYDSAGVVMLKAINIPTAIITGENTKIVTNRAKKLNIPHLFQGINNKLSIAITLSNKLNIKLDNIAYIGDDINDIHLFKQVGLSACPSSAPQYIQDLVDWVLPIKGGEGVFRVFVEKYLMENNLLEKVLLIINQRTNHE